ncbi:MAG: 23S rRNA (adenine(2030)-N(6))-methyltransferase RlmJ [Paracoccaceae bacterium]|nr:MAG: 23S rRNA (adenine(2030)-N(6))-methyltransferase RlmJ [Paracoccaceae bacterium]
MLSYQHLYHAGNPADVHKHAGLALMLDYMTAKDKPLTYIETHAGRGLYDLDAAEARRTGEAAAGVGRLAGRFPPDHPYARRLAQVRAHWGAQAYPGSPLIAALTLRMGDVMHLAELHPREHAALAAAMSGFGAHLHDRDGIEMALALTPPMPRRGLMLIDPSWEVKEDYDAIPLAMGRIARKWNVGVIALWYPILASGPHLAMLDLLAGMFPEGLRHEVRFPPVRPGHRMAGSGLFVVNPPWGTAEGLAGVAEVFGSA